MATPIDATIVAVLLFDPVSVFETAVAVEVFGLDRTDDGVPPFRLRTCSDRPGELSTKGGGFTMNVQHGLRTLDRADVVIVPGWAGANEPAPPRALAALRKASARGARIVSFCSGAFVLAQAGLLDGRRVATHWHHAAALASGHPELQVDANVLYVDDGSNIFTSAGTAAAIDLCLHLVRLDHGAEIANIVARRMVMPPHRVGGQAQYVDSIPSGPAALGQSDDFGLTLDWALIHLDDEHSIESLASRANMSARTFARRFRERTDTTPLQWLLHQRVIAAQRLLETTEHPIDLVAQRTGLGSAANLRLHFGRIVGTTPMAYRRTFHRAG